MRLRREIEVGGFRLALQWIQSPGGRVKQAEVHGCGPDPLSGGGVSLSRQGPRSGVVAPGAGVFEGSKCLLTEKSPRKENPRVAKTHRVRVSTSEIQCAKYPVNPKPSMTNPTAPKPRLNSQYLRRRVSTETAPTTIAT